MTTAKLFQNGRSQAVRLPKEFRFGGTTVTIQKYGDGVLLLPECKGWDAFFQACEDFPTDFFSGGRKQPPIQERFPLI